MKQFNYVSVKGIFLKSVFYTLCTLFVATSHASLLVEQEIIPPTFSQRNLAPLTEEERDHFFQEGYFIRKNVLDPLEIENSLNHVNALIGRAEALFEKLRIQDYFPTEAGEYSLNDGTSFHVVNATGSVGYHFDRSENDGKTSTRIVIGKTSDGNMSIHRFVWAGGLESDLLEVSRKFFGSASQLLGCDNADWIINSVHPKIDSEVKFDWHQDVRHRKRFDPDWEKWARNEQGSYVVVIAALTNADESNGGLWGVAGIPGDLCLENIQDFETLKEKAHLNNAFPLNLNPGDAVWMHPYFVHGSWSNESREPRILLINGFSYIDNQTGLHANTKPYPGKGSAQEVSLIE